MSKYIPGNQKHLTLNDRIYIENELAKGTSFEDIAAFLCKDPTTISKEVRAHRISDWYHKGTFYNSKNFCIHRYHCKKSFVILTNTVLWITQLSDDSTTATLRRRNSIRPQIGVFLSEDLGTSLPYREETVLTTF